MAELVRLRQSSMQRTDSKGQTRDDAAGALPTPRAGTPDAVGFTELKGNALQAVQERCKEKDWLLVRKGTVGVALSPRNTLLERNVVDVLSGFRSPSGKGSYAARQIVEVTFRTPGGLIVTVHEAHWITDAPSDRREDKRRDQSERMAERVVLHSKGRRLSFWMGDTNEDEAKREGEVQRPLTRAGLVSIYDDLDRYPNTHGRKTIDVIGRCKEDRRVKAKNLRVGGKRHSDHRRVDAVYEV